MFEKNNIEIADLLLGKIYGQTVMNGQRTFVMVTSSLIYLVLFNALYGNLISEDFRDRSVYIFSRIRNRKAWFYKKALEMLMISSAYSLIFLGTNLFICNFSSTRTIDINAFIIFIKLFIILTMALTITTLLINLISIKRGNSVAFVTVYLVIVSLIFLVLKSENISIVQKYPILISLNPVSGISFNFTGYPLMQVLLTIYYILIIIMTLILGAYQINKMDISLFDAENI